MTVAELFEYVDVILENPFPDNIKRRWLNQIEAEIQVDVLLLAPDGIVKYGEEDKGAELIAPAPYDELYSEYLFWRICLAQHENELADNYAATFNRLYNEYVRFVCETINPGCGMAERVRYYLTAYQIAVKHGYAGTEAEWVDSLKGPEGKPGAGLHILGHVEQEADLPENPEQGDGYLVGEENLLYIWDGDAWFFKLPLRGEKGEPGKTPQKGLDYWTPEEEAEITAAKNAANTAAGNADSAAGAAQTAAASAETAAGNANQAASAANTEAENARTAATAAADAADNAQTVADEVRQAKENGEFKGDPFTYDDFTQDQLAKLKGADGVSIGSVVPLEETEDGNVYSVHDTDGNLIGNFTAPKGQAGTLTIGEIKGLDAGSEPVAIEMPGSTENERMYSLGIPRGDRGYGVRVERVDRYSDRTVVTLYDESSNGVYYLTILNGKDANVTLSAILDALGYEPANPDEINALVAKKVDKDQGTENAGKILGIGKDGFVVPVDAPSGGGSGDSGSAEVTAESIREALGYEPAKQSDVEQLTDDLEERALKTEIPEVPVQSVNNKTGAVSLNAGDVGADPAGTASGAVGAHNVSGDAHNDIRLLIEGLTTRLNALANSTDEDLDQMAELVAYIKSNKSLIDNITTSKVNVTDIVNNLTTNVTNKPLSAAQGVALKGLIDDLSNGKLDADKLPDAIDTALAQAKDSGEFDGKDGQRGTGLLAVTTAPASYTTEVGGITPKYRMAISTIKAQAGVTEVLLGDTIRQSYYHYPIAYVDASYAYCTTRVSIRGASGASVTSENITTALGYTPAKQQDVEQISEDLEERALKTEIPEVPVQSVNGKTGAVELTASDVGATTEDYVDTEVAKLKAQGVQQTPLYPEGDTVDECLAWLAENGDQTKVYLLPDGMLYAWMMTTVESGPTYTNQLPLAKASGGGEYVGANGEDGYNPGFRISSSGTEKAAAGYACTGFIPAVKGDTIRIKNVTQLTSSTNPSDYAVAYFFTSAYAKTSGAVDVELNATYANGVYTFTIPNYADIAFFRVSLVGVSDNTIITVNEEISEGGGTTTGYAWASTGHAFVPADYEDRIVKVETTTAKHTTKIAALEKAVETGGSDATETDAINRIKAWKYPIFEDAPIFLLETNKPAIATDKQTTEGIYAAYDALMAVNSHYITRVNCGKASDKTTPIYAYHFTEPTPHYERPDWSETKPVILVCSGIHPFEQAGVWSMYYALEEITNNAKLLDLRRNVHFIVVPMINPTAFEDEMGQRNPDGVQMHYNFEVDFKYPGDPGYVENGLKNHGGETPLSIPESQYFDAIMQEYKDTLACVLSCHNFDVDPQRGTSFLWGSCATHFMCNLVFRLVDKMSAAWHEKHGTAFEDGIRWANDYVIEQSAAGNAVFPSAYIQEQPEWDYRVGMAALSGSGGTEYKQALKYGVHGVNVEVCRRCMVLDKNYNASWTENVTTMGAETYINFFRTFMAAYDPKDKKDYAPNLPWSD